MTGTMPALREGSLLSWKPVEHLPRPRRGRQRMLKMNTPKHTHSLVFPEARMGQVVQLTLHPVLVHPVANPRRTLRAALMSSTRNALQAKGACSRNAHHQDHFMNKHRCAVRADVQTVPPHSIRIERRVAGTEPNCRGSKADHGR